MNTFYYEISEELKKEFKKCFAENNKDDESKFVFFKKFLMFIENDASSFNHLILFKNPLKDEQANKFHFEFNQKCRNYLESKSKEKDLNVTPKTRAKATCYLGSAYEHGLFDYQRDFDRSFQYYQLSAQMKNSMGCYKLAQCYENGKGVSQDPTIALYFYRCAAKYGLTDALHTYGLLLARGELGSDKDEKTGLHFLSRASVQADEIYPYAQFDIGKWYETAKKTLDSSMDEDYAFNIYMKGAELNDPNCQYRIAKSYEKGDLNQKKDFKKVMKWYKRAAEGGNLDAQLFLAAIYTTGRGNEVPSDLKLAYQWMLETGTRGNAKSLLHLGEFSRMKQNENILLAMWWFMIADVAGCPEAKAKYEETKAEVEKIDDGPELPGGFCGCGTFCC